MVTGGGEGCAEKKILREGGRGR